jgi:hypothetical protein
MLGSLASVEAATAAIAHEIRQPLAGIVSLGSAGLRWLNRKAADLEKARSCFSSILGAAQRSDEIITSVRGLFKRTPDHRATVQLNDGGSPGRILTQTDLPAETGSGTRPICPCRRGNKRNHDVSSHQVQRKSNKIRFALADGRHNIAFGIPGLSFVVCASRLWCVRFGKFYDSCAAVAKGVSGAVRAASQWFARRDPNCRIG